MKQLLIFLCMIVTAFCLDFRKADLETIRGDTITVQVEGEVSNPGPVTAHPYMTVQEVLEQVELLPDADTSVLNPDTILNDHDILRIPAKKKEYHVEQKVDADRIYRNFRTVMISVDQSLDEVRLTEKQAHREQAGKLEGREASPAEIELFSDLLAASYSGDPEFALEKIAGIKYYLHRQQIEVVDYSEDNASYFDMMPGASAGTIRPAMIADGKLLKKGLASKGN